MSQNHSEFKYRPHQSDSEEEEEDLISIQIQSKTVHISYSLLGKYSKLIREKYLISDIQDHLSQDIQHFQQESNIKEDSIISFLQYFRNSELTITNDNYQDFYKLSDFFQIKTLLKALDKYATINSNDVDFNIRIILDEIASISENTKYEISEKMKKNLSENVDECLQNKNFEELPLYVIYEILSRAKKSSFKSDLLFDFINQSKSTRFILFIFLDLQFLSDDKFDILYEDYINSQNDCYTKKYYQYLSCNLIYIKSLKEQIKETKDNYQVKLKNIEDEKVELQNQLNLMNEKCIQLQTKLEETKNDFQKKIDLKEKENSIINNKIDQLNRKFDEIKITHQDEMNKLNEEKTNLQEEKITILKKCDDLQLKLNKFDQINDNVCKGINSYFGSPSNPKEAFSYFEISSKEGNRYGSYLAGIFYNKGIGVEPNFDRAKSFYTKSGEQGNSYAYNKIGLCIEKGEGVEKNLSKAVEYYEKSSELGNSVALCNLGNCYKNGEGVEKNFSKAVEYYEKSSKLGNSDALRNLGVCYENGRGVEKNLSKAVEYYEKSSKLGNSTALCYLGVCYEKGEGVEKNLSKANEYYEKSSNLGYSTATYYLGMNYEDGIGFEKNLSKAIEYYQKASELGHSSAKTKLEELRQQTNK